MRLLIVTVLLSLGCSHNAIGPDDGGKADGGTTDGAPTPDGSTPDGSTPDGSSPDGGNVKGDQGYTAGSRLKVRYYEGSDGSEQQLGFYDTTMNTDCYFTRATDNSIRCIPSGQVVAQMGFTATPYFTDSGCSQPMAYIQSSCTPTYAAQYDSASISTGTCAVGGYAFHVFNIGTQFTGATYWQKSGIDCNPSAATTFTSQGYALYNVGSEIAPTSLVSATNTTIK